LARQSDLDLVLDQLLTLSRSGETKSVLEHQTPRSIRTTPRIIPAWTRFAYVVKVAPDRHGVSCGNGWTHIDGWSERVSDYIVGVRRSPILPAPCGLAGDRTGLAGIEARL